MLRADGDQTPCVFNDRVHLEPVTDNAGVRQQPLPVSLSVGGNRVQSKAFKGTIKVRLLSQNDLPREARLIDFQGQTFQQRSIFANWEAVLRVMIGLVQRVSGRKFTVSSHWGKSRLSGGGALIIRNGIPLAA